MSAQAITQVTRALRMLLRSQLALVSPTAVVTLHPPGDSLPAVSGVNLYLYRVVESPAFKNEPWRGDRTTAAANRPALALQLSYLLTPLAPKPDDASFEQGDDAHTMLGASMLTLHENPILNQVHIPDAGAIAGFDADVVFSPDLLASFEQVKITLVPTSIDELSKIWATINQPYRLSIAYEVSLVELTPTPPPPVTGAIVTSTGLNVIAISAPSLSALIPAHGALGTILQITGAGFSFPGQKPIVRVGGQVAVIQSAPPPTDTALFVALPTDLDAGPWANVTVTLNGRASAPLSLFATPWLTSLQPIRTALQGLQTLTLSGSGFTTAPQEVRLDGPGGPIHVSPVNAGGSDTQASISIPPALANGLYNVRLVAGPAGANVSNSRTLEVVPRLDAVIATPATGSLGQPVSRLTLNGLRLKGADIRLSIDGETFTAGPNGNASQIIFNMGRALVAGAHQASVQVDGHASHTVGFTL